MRDPTIPDNAESCPAGTTPEILEGGVGDPQVPLPTRSRRLGVHAVMVHSPGSGQRVRVEVPWTSSWFGGTLRR